MAIFRPVRSETEQVGTILLFASTEKLRAQLVTNAWILTFIFLGGTMLGLTIVRPLHRTITGPLLNLSQAARRVSRDNDYQLRVPRDGADEIGDLAESFDGMLQTISRHTNSLLTLNCELLRATLPCLALRAHEKGIEKRALRPHPDGRADAGNRRL